MYVCIMYKSFLLKPTTSHLLVSYVRQDPHQLPKPKNYPSVSYDLAIQKSAWSVCKRDDHVYSSWIHNIMLADHFDLKVAF